MGVPRTKHGFPDVQGDNTVCPFCGDVCHQTVDGSSSYAPDSVSVSIGFHCMNGCCWELHIGSEEGNLQAHCVLMEIHEELRKERHGENVMSC